MSEIGPLAGVDDAAIEALLDRAFGADRKTRAAYRLREGAAWLPALSFAAFAGDRLVGTLQSWPVLLDETPLVMVGPVAVEPAAQGEGVGKALMAALLGVAGDRPLMMVGDPDYYGRFGFTAERTAAWEQPIDIESHRLLARGCALPERGRLMTTRQTFLAPRFPWPSDFPDVIVHTTVAIRDAHPRYGAAKSGDPRAASDLAVDLINPVVVEGLRAHLATRDVILLPVTADEVSGFNAIPDAMAELLGDMLDLDFSSGEIVQINKVGHTRARAFQRIVTPALFDGYVRAGAQYILVDDHVGLGGTLANLRGFLESRGATVIGMTALTESRDGARIALRQGSRKLLWDRYGQQLDTLWRSQFGHGIDTLTELEAVQLCRQQSVAAIADFLAQASVEAGRRGLAATAPAS